MSATFTPHYTARDVDRALADFTRPPEFTFGVSTAGYQVEGGFNGLNEPKNNWYWPEIAARVERTGAASRFWELYPEDIRRAAALGCQGFRLGLEWARLQPGTDPRSAVVPPFSLDAARRYAAILATVFDNGLTPAVTLHHFTHPLWAGPGFWLNRARVLDLFPAYVEFAVTEINRILTEELGRPPVPYYITVNEPAMVPLQTFITGVFPSGLPRGVTAAVQCYENMLIGHVLAYRTVHRLYRDRGWPAPVVTVNNWTASLYVLDKLSQDLFLARRNGIERGEVRTYLGEQRLLFRSQMRQAEHVRGPRRAKRLLEAGLDGALWRALGADPFSGLVDLIYSGSEPDLLDAVGFDYYDPFLANYLDIGFPRLAHVRRQPWEWNLVPQHLGLFLDAYSWTARGLPLHLLENGMSIRAIGTKAWPRADGAQRGQALKAMLYEAVRAIGQGIDLRAFYYWSLIDNYEWGSFEPRFGLCGVDYRNGARRLSTDIAGDDAAGAYRDVIQAFRRGDTDALRRALLPG